RVGRCHPGLFGSVVGAGNPGATLGKVGTRLEHATPHRPLRRTGGERGSAQLVDDAGNHLVPSPGLDRSRSFSHWRTCNASSAPDKRVVPLPNAMRLWNPRSRALCSVGIFMSYRHFIPCVVEAAMYRFFLRIVCSPRNNFSYTA